MDYGITITKPTKQLIVHMYRAYMIIPTLYMHVHVTSGMTFNTTHITQLRSTSGSVKDFTIYNHTAHMHGANPSLYNMYLCYIY